MSKARVTFDLGDAPGPGNSIKVNGVEMADSVRSLRVSAGADEATIVTLEFYASVEGSLGDASIKRTLLPHPPRDRELDAEDGLEDVKR